MSRFHARDDFWRAVACAEEATLMLHHCLKLLSRETDTTDDETILRLLHTIYHRGGDARLALDRLENAAQDAADEAQKKEGAP